MILTLTASDLKFALNTVKPATLSKVDLMSQYIRVGVDFEKSILTVTAYDYFMTITTNIEIDYDKEDEDFQLFVVKHDLFSNIISKLSGDITLDLAGERLIVKEGKNKFNVSLASIDATIEPPVTYESLRDVEVTEVKSGKYLKLAAEQASSDMSKGCLTAVQVSGNEIAATDSFRLFKINDSDDIIDENKYLIPAEFLLKTSIITSGKPFNVRFVENYIVVSDLDSHTFFASVMVDGSYPPYNSLIPNRFNLEVEGIETEGFKMAIDKVSALSEKNIITLEIKSDMLVLEAEGFGGKGHIEFNLDDEIELESPLTFTINRAFLVAALKSISDETFTLKVNQPNQPMIITSDFEASTVGEIGTMTQLLMPCQSRG